MKTTEIREMSASELDSKLAGLKEELFNLRFQMATGQCENPMKIREVKKSIAPHQDHSASTRVKCLSVFEV